jgi:hypothetical protein
MINYHLTFCRKFLAFKIAIDALGGGLQDFTFSVFETSFGKYHAVLNLSKILSCFSFKLWLRCIFITVLILLYNIYEKKLTMMNVNHSLI